MVKQYLWPQVLMVVGWGWSSFLALWESPEAAHNSEAYFLRASPRKEPEGKGIPAKRKSQPLIT